MILVKSLIWLFLILIGFYAYDHLHLLSYFDGREGFQKNDKDEKKTIFSEEIMKASEIAANKTIDLKFSEQLPLEQYKNISNDAEILSDLQNKITDLLKLKDEAIVINQSL